MLNLDFSNVPNREPLEEGIYVITISKVEEKIAKSGNPMLTVEFDVEGNRKLWDNYVLTDAALWKLKELCEAVGMDTSQVLNFEPTDIVGLQVQAKIIQEEYNGDIVNRVKKVYPIA